MKHLMETVQSAHWGDAFRFLAEGGYPVGLQLLMLNTVVLAIWMLRRARGAYALRRETMIVVQYALIVANIAILMQRDLERVIDTVL